MMQMETVNQTREEVLAALYQMMQANQDEDNAQKILDLYDKLHKQELNVSFSGHFSAGKSSMINYLLEKDILPKSPIPTSANIVKITSGEGYARVFFNHQDPVEYQEPYDLDMIKAYSKDRDSIKRIEISTKDPIIPHGAAILDTPGIDAADDADRLMTESALHLVDVLFYVMDYNHVQSEVNLYFLKSLQENNIPFYLIINQVDKHNEEELSFASFKESIRQTFASWEIQPERVFYTSLYDMDLTINQFGEVKQTLQTILRNPENRYNNTDASLQHVINKHKTFLEDQYENLKAEIQMDEETETQLSTMQTLEEKSKQLAKEPEELKQAFQRELTQTLDNAYLMPKELRDKAALFLESEQPNFKVGLFGAKKKTAEARNQRLEDFQQALKESIETAIQWKLRDKFNQLLRDFGLNDHAVIEAVNKFSISYESQDIKALVKKGAQVNGESVLNYTRDVAADIKAKYKREAISLLEQFKQVMGEEHAATLTDYEEQIGTDEKLQEIKDKYNKIDEELKGKQRAVDELKNAPVVDEKAWQVTVQEKLQKEQVFLPGEELVMEGKENTTERATEDIQQFNENKSTITAENMIERIDESIRLTEDLPGFNDLLDDLKLKRNRLSNRTFTIALFGAFSAGKSSFSNALIGEQILPVSPNPTTATVNRIHPVTDKMPHGTVKVTMKKEDTLYQELLAMTDKFSPKGESFERLLRWIEKKKLTEDAQLNNMYQAYIQALLKGYGTNKEHIGKSITISIEEFATYVTDETIAGYIETIDVYYDCSITQQGITLVDTPGADSVNARHTNVAFNYIKHADAILYVTYYNHALSRADRDFLMQLGRVKEAFQLDKMFFIVNAADLAENEEELQLVTSYVQEELMKLGIRQARLFPVSSKQSMEEKAEGRPLNEKMQAFQDAFFSFIHQDLAALTIESAKYDIKRVYDTLAHYLSTINLDDKEKEKQKQKINKDRIKAISSVDKLETTVYKEQIEQRIERQLYYVIERLGIRYHDMFKEMFNPTTITENGRKAMKELKNALDNLLEYVRFELGQELQAVSLRMEGYTLDLANEVYQAMQSENKAINALFSLPNQFDYELSTPSYEKNLTTLNKKEFEATLSKYRGTKAFFVQNEREIMKEEIYTMLLPVVEHFIDTNQKEMLSSYLNQWDQLITTMKETTNQRLNKQVENYFMMLETPSNLPNLKESLNQLEQLVN
jgi:predicted GTPase